MLRDAKKNRTPVGPKGPSRRKGGRFRIARLEERIAPTPPGAPGSPHKCNGRGSSC